MTLLSKIQSVAQLEQVEVEKKRERDEKKNIEQIKWITENIQELSVNNREKSISYLGFFTEEIKSELRSKGYVLKSKVDGGPQGTGYEYTEISIPVKVTKR